MLKKIWFMFVLLSVLMVSGCSSKQKEDVVCNVVSEVESSEMDAAEDLEVMIKRLYQEALYQEDYERVLWDFVHAKIRL